jgi:hypothetical protein
VGSRSNPRNLLTRWWGQPDLAFGRRLEGRKWACPDYPRGAVVEIALEFRATLDYRPRPFLQLALCSFEEWSPDLHMQVLSQSYSFSHVA